MIPLIDRQPHLNDRRPAADGPQCSNRGPDSRRGSRLAYFGGEVWLGSLVGGGARSVDFGLPSSEVRIGLRASAQT